MAKSLCDSCRFHHTRRYLDARNDEHIEVSCEIKYDLRLDDVTLECDDFRSGED